MDAPVGILGFGRQGWHTAKDMLKKGRTVLWYDPEQSGNPLDHPRLQRVSRLEHLCDSPWIFLCCHLNGSFYSEIETLITHGSEKNSLILRPLVPVGTADGLHRHWRKKGLTSPLLSCPAPAIPGEEPVVIGARSEKESRSLRRLYAADEGPSVLVTSYRDAELITCATEWTVRMKRRFFQDIVSAHWGVDKDVVLNAMGLDPRIGQGWSSWLEGGDDGIEPGLKSFAGQLKGEGIPISFFPQKMH